MGNCSTESPNIGEGGVIKPDRARETALPSCHRKSLVGQQAVAEIILQIILLLTVRGVRNEGQQCGRGGSFFAKDMPDAQGPY